MPKMGIIIKGLEIDGNVMFLKVNKNIFQIPFETYYFLFNWNAKDVVK